MRRTPAGEQDKLAEATGHCDAAALALAGPAQGSRRVQAVRRPGVGARAVASDAEPPAGIARPTGRRDTRAHCASCGIAGECSSARADGGACPLEADTFPELAHPERIAALLRDVLRSELRTFFRAKRLEARSGAKIDGEASKLAQALFKQIECYLDICQRVRPAQTAGVAGPAVPASVYPSLQAAVRASGDGLFSEVPRTEARERLRRDYLRVLREEDAILRCVQTELDEGAGSAG